MKRIIYILLLGAAFLQSAFSQTTPDPTFSAGTNGVDRDPDNVISMRDHSQTWHSRIAYDEDTGLFYLRRSGRTIGVDEWDEFNLYNISKADQDSIIRFEIMPGDSIFQIELVSGKILSDTIHLDYDYIPSRLNIQWQSDSPIWADGGNADISTADATYTQGNNISFDEATGVINLKAGSRYRCEADIQGSFNNTTGENIHYFALNGTVNRFYPPDGISVSGYDAPSGTGTVRSYARSLLEWTPQVDTDIILYSNTSDGYLATAYSSTIFCEEIIDALNLVGGVNPNDLDEQDLSSIVLGNEVTIDISNGNSTTFTAPTGTDDQTLNIVGNELYIENGNSVTLPTGTGGTDDQALSITGTTLTLEDGGSVTIPQDGFEANTDDQTLSITGDQLTIQDGNTVTIPQDGFEANTDDQTLSITGNVITIEDGNSITLPSGTVDTDDQTLSITGDQLTIQDGNTVTIPQDGTGTDDQALSITGTTLTLENGGSVTIPQDGFEANTDDQTLSITGNVITIEDGNSITLPSGTVDTDDQTLSITGDQLTIQDGNTVTIPQDGTGTDDQALSITGTTLTLEDGGSVTIPQDGFEANTDDQTLSITGDQLTIQDGNTITIPQDGTGTDDQSLSITGTTLTLEDGGSVTIPQDGFEANTDEQTLSVTEDQDSNFISIINGNTISIAKSDSSKWEPTGTNDGIQPKNNDPVLINPTYTGDITNGVALEVQGRTLIRTGNGGLGLKTSTGNKIYEWIVADGGMQLILPDELYRLRGSGLNTDQITFDFDNNLTTFDQDVRFNQPVIDSDGDLGTDGQIWSTKADGTTDWINAVANTSDQDSITRFEIVQDSILQIELVSGLVIIDTLPKPVFENIYNVDGTQTDATRTYQTDGQDFRFRNGNATAFEITNLQTNIRPPVLGTPIVGSYQSNSFQLSGLTAQLKFLVADNGAGAANNRIELLTNGSNTASGSAGIIAYDVNPTTTDEDELYIFTGQPTTANDYTGNILQSKDEFGQAEWSTYKMPLDAGVAGQVLVTNGVDSLKFQDLNEISKITTSIDAPTVTYLDEYGVAPTFTNSTGTKLAANTSSSNNLHQYYLIKKNNTQAYIESDDIHQITATFSYQVGNVYYLQDDGTLANSADSNNTTPLDYISSVLYVIEDLGSNNYIISLSSPKHFINE